MPSESLLLPPHAVEDLLLLAENEQLRMLNAQLQWSLVSVRGTLADAMAENAELTRNADQQFSLFSGKLARLQTENADLKRQIAKNADLQYQSAEIAALQRQVADLTNKLGRAEADLQECVQDHQQIMQRMTNMQPSAPGSARGVPQEESRASSSVALSRDKDSLVFCDTAESMNKILRKLQKAAFSCPPAPLHSLPTQITATPMPGAMSTLIFTLSTFIHCLEKELHTWGSSLIAAHVSKQQATRYVVEQVVLTWQSNIEASTWYERVRGQKAWREFYHALQVEKVDSIAPLSSAIFQSVTGSMTSSLLTAMWRNSFRPHSNSLPDLLIEANKLSDCYLALTQYDTAEILPEAACIKE